MPLRMVIHERGAPPPWEPAPYSLEVSLSLPASLTIQSDVRITPDLLAEAARLLTSAAVAAAKAMVMNIPPAPKDCDHKFVDSKHCLKCGWVPPEGPAEPIR